MKRVLWVLPVVLAVVGARDAAASCNIIPSASKDFRARVGAVNKPFASPGDLVEVTVPSSCNAASLGLQAAGNDHVVTVVYTPPHDGQRRIIYLTDDCGTDDRTPVRAFPSNATTRETSRSSRATTGRI